VFGTNCIFKYYLERNDRSQVPEWARYLDIMTDRQLQCDFYFDFDRLCGLVVIVPGYRSRGPASIPSAIRFSEGISHVNTIEELL
jgi:hypothetical protein